MQELYPELHAALPATFVEAKGTCPIRNELLRNNLTSFTKMARYISSRSRAC